MSWNEVLAPEVLPFYVATLAMLALAAFLVLAGTGSATRAMAAYLILLSMSTTMEVAAPSAEGNLGEALHSASTVGLLLILLPLAWFISTWPHRRGPLARLPHGEWFLIAAGAVLLALALAWPSLLVTPDFQHFGYSQAGPLLFIVLAGVATPGFVAWILARDLQRSPPGQIQSRLVLAIAFTCYPLFRGTISAYTWVTGDFPAAYDGRGWQLAGEVLTLVAGMLAADGARRIVQHSRGSRGHVPWGLMGLFVLAVLLGILQMETYQRGLVSVWTTLPFALIMLFLPVVATYGLLRGGVLGLDLKVRFAISKSTVAAIFIAVFFLASEAAQQFFGDRTGSTYIGIGIAGTLVFAMAPIQRVAERLAEKAVPDASAPKDRTSDRRLEVYRGAVQAAMKDGRLSQAEERMLFELADELGLTAAQAVTVRQESETGARPL